MATNEPPEKGKGVAVFALFTLKEALHELEAEEAQKPPSHRRAVPTIPELAEAMGITRQALYNTANGQVQSVNLALLGRLLTAFRERGFAVEVSDLIRAYPAEEGDIT